MFTPSNGGNVTNDEKARINVGKKRFSIFGKAVYNNITS